MNNEMTIKEAMREKTYIENKIREMLIEFTKNTGMRVEDVDIKPYASADGYFAYGVLLRVEMP